MSASLYGARGRLIICSKSRWSPAIRREHALAREAARDGREVMFLERPSDVRTLVERGGRADWVAGLISQPAQQVEPQIAVYPRSTIVPAHRSDYAAKVDSWLFRRRLARLPGVEEAMLVATLPWHWPAVASTPAAHRVFDYADDWEALLPGREQAVRALLARVNREADAVIVVSEALQELFTNAIVVRNGVSDDVLATPVTPRPTRRRLAYLGTLTDRFDAPFVGQVMLRLPNGWTLDIYGPCQYPGLRDTPSREFQALLEAHSSVRWHGAIDRPRIAEVLDQADVLIVPHRKLKPGSGRSRPSWRGDVMKLYDYAARARPIVATDIGADLLVGPPHLVIANDESEFVQAVLAAASLSEEALAAQRTWSEEQRWSSRWQEWKLAAATSS